MNPGLIKESTAAFESPFQSKARTWKCTWTCLAVNKHSVFFLGRREHAGIALRLSSAPVLSTLCTSRKQLERRSPTLLPLPNCQIHPQQLSLTKSTMEIPLFTKAPFIINIGNITVYKTNSSTIVFVEVPKSTMQIPCYEIIVIQYHSKYLVPWFYYSWHSTFCKGCLRLRACQSKQCQQT